MGYQTIAYSSKREHEDGPSLATTLPSRRSSAMNISCRTHPPAHQFLAILGRSPAFRSCPPREVANTDQFLPCCSLSLNCSVLHLRLRSLRFGASRRPLVLPGVAAAAGIQCKPYHLNDRGAKGCAPFSVVG